MKLIIKGTEPLAWKIYCTTPGVAFSAIPELKEALLQEQGHLCCYCLSRIDETKMKVEHWKPRKTYPELILDYSNLMAACEGNFCGEQHCDTLKGHSELVINPTDKKNNVESIIKYRWSTAAIEVNPVYQKDVYEIINLNHPILRANRKKALVALEAFIKKGKHTEAEYTRLLEKFRNRDASGKFNPHCMILIKFLEKKLRQYK